MKRIVVMAFAAVLAIGVSAMSFSADKSLIKKADKIVFVGVDYSMTKMVGANFKEPSEIFPEMLEKWNEMFVKQRVSKLEKSIDKKVVLDLEGVNKVNKRASKSQIKMSPGPSDDIDETHISSEKIASKIQSYELESQNGIGLVYIVDRLIEAGEKKGAVYIVYFDIATREVIFSKREVVEAKGFGFRNLWFSVVREASAKM